MTTPTQFEEAGILRVALTYYLCSAVQATVSSSDIINDEGAFYEFKITGIPEPFKCYFTHEEISPVFKKDDEFDLVVERAAKQFKEQFPETEIQEVIRRFSLVS